MTLTLQVFEFSNLSSLFALLIWPFQDPTLQKHIQRNGPIRTLKVFFKKNTPTLMAFTGVTNTYGPSFRQQAGLQQEVTRPKTRLKPTSPTKSGVVVGSNQNA